MSNTPKVPDDRAIAKKYLTKITNSTQRGVDFTLSFNQYKKLLLTKTCFYTGVTLTTSTESGTIANDARTLDRIDPNEGYTPKNTVACSHLANRIKNSLECLPESREDITQSFTDAILVMSKVVEHLNK